MATTSAIREAMTTLAANFPHYRKNDELGDILHDAVIVFSDDVLKQAVRRLIATAARSPVTADIVGACQTIANQHAAMCASTAKPNYVDYWDRPANERAEIDDARNECMRVMRELDSGMPVASVMAAYEERIRKSRGTTNTPQTTPPAREAPAADFFDW